MTDEVFVDCHDDELEIKYKYKTIRGLTKYTSISEKFITKEITIQNLIDCHAREIIIIPIFQRDLNIDKVDNMIITYKKDKESFDFLTNKIQLVHMKEYKKYLLIDGQHRFHMYKRLLDMHIINDTQKILVNIINCNSKEEIYEMYKHFNYDIIDTLKQIDKNQETPIPENMEQFRIILKKLEYEKFSNIINDKYKKYFSTDSNYVYSLEKFIQILYDSDYIDLFESSKIAFDYLIETNNIYCNKFYTSDNISDMKLNKEELYNIKQKIIFSLKNNNFIKLLIEDDIKNKFFEASHSFIDKKKKWDFMFMCEH